MKNNILIRHIKSSLENTVTRTKNDLSDLRNTVLKFKSETDSFINMPTITHADNLSKYFIVQPSFATKTIYCDKIDGDAHDIYTRVTDLNLDDPMIHLLDIYYDVEDYQISGYLNIYIIHNEYYVVRFENDRKYDCDYRTYNASGGCLLVFNNLHDDPIAYIACYCGHLNMYHSSKGMWCHSHGDNDYGTYSGMIKSIKRLLFKD